MTGLKKRLKKNRRRRSLFWKKGERERVMNSPPPAWHLEILREREEAIARGEEDYQDLEETRLRLNREIGFNQ